MTKFKTYRVTLHNRTKRSLIMVVKYCVSETAAIRTANVLYRMSRGYCSWDPFTADMVTEISDG